MSSPPRGCLPLASGLAVGRTRRAGSGHRLPWGQHAGWAVLGSPALAQPVNPRRSSTARQLPTPSVGPTLGPATQPKFPQNHSG